MRASVKRYHGPDVDLDSVPLDDPANVGYLIQMMVGPADGPGEESFEVVVCTTAWLERRVVQDGPTLGRHLLIVDAFDWPRVRFFLNKTVEASEGRDWADVANKVGRIVSGSSKTIDCNSGFV